MIWSVAWKNVWRNKLRSAVVIIAVAFGLFGGVFSIGIMQGMLDQKFKTAIENETSHLQIHNPKFLENNEAEYYIENSVQLIKDIKAIPQVEKVSTRTSLLAMVNTSYTNAGVMIYGINPDKEKLVTSIYKTILDSAGTYFEADKKNQILIGDNLARNLQLASYTITDISLQNLKLQDVPDDILSKLATIKDIKYRNEKFFDDALVELLGEKDQRKYKFAIISYTQTFKVGSKIKLTLQDKEGEMVTKAFSVCGVFDSKNGMYDGLNVFVKDEDLKSLTGYESGDTHEMAITLKDIKNVEVVKKLLIEKYPDFDIQTWSELQPMVFMMKQWMSIFYFVFVGIILFALGFGIVNTMLMVVLERVKELGMLMAVGMNKVKIFMMIMLESVFLSLVGGFIGMGIGWLSIFLLEDKGIDFSQWAQEGFEAMGFDSVMYPSIEPSYFVGITILVILTGIVAAIYPARKALKFNPADAIRIDV